MKFALRKVPSKRILSRKTTNKDLRMLYDALSGTVFRKLKMPKDIGIRFAGFSDERLMGQTLCDDRGHPRFILISERLKKLSHAIIFTMTHEMVHVSDPEKYKCCEADVFNKRMIEIAQMNAFKGVW